MHSVNSDGTYTTQEILDMLHDKGCNLFSFTDHDSVRCYKDIVDGIANPYEEMIILPGVEISCRVDGNLRDMLGYGISVSTINSTLEEKYSKEMRIKKQSNILEQLKENCRKLNLKFDDTIEVVEGKKAEGFVVMYNELNRYTSNIEKYPFIANNTIFYWEHFSAKGDPFYVDETYDLYSFAEAVELIHESGGKAFLAHPFAYGMKDNEVEFLVQVAVNAGIDGIELKHSSNKNDHVQKVRSFADRYNLLCSGGTDFHGKTKPGLELVNAYGNVNVQIEDINNWIFNEKLYGGGKYADFSELWT